METETTIIVGGGLSGLYAAYLLHQRGQPFQLLEARSEFGGRIRTIRRDGFALELGASWFWPRTNPRVTRLVEEFGLDSFSQYTDGDVLVERPGGSLEKQPHKLVDPRLSLRLKDGTSALFEALLATLPADRLHLGQKVISISRSSDREITLVASSAGQERGFRANNVIMALPLRLLAETITLSPAHAEAVLDRFHATPTWMAGEAKFLAAYDKPFWREMGLSGSAFGQIGPLAECHDASPSDGPGALLGFLLPDVQERQRRGAELISACLEQLARYFGDAALSPLETVLIDWATEPLTATALDVPLMEHPIYGIGAESYRYWDRHLRIAGTESAAENGGYLEGALEAAERATDGL